MIMNPFRPDEPIPIGATVIIENIRTTGRARTLITKHGREWKVMTNNRLVSTKTGQELPTLFVESFAGADSAGLTLDERKAYHLFRIVQC